MLSLPHGPIRRITLVAYLAILVYLLLTPSPPDVPGDDDKKAHLAGFFVLGVLVWWNVTGPWREAVAFVVATAVGGVTELAQAHIPGRTLEVGDVVANFVGSGLGAFGMGLAPMRIKRWLAG